MSPKLNLSYRGYTFFFYSHEESRPHVHVSKGAAAGGPSTKFWLTRDGVELASNGARLSSTEINRLAKFLESNRDYLLARWMEFFVVG